MRTALCPFLLAVVLGGCASLPSLEGRSVSTAIMDTADTRIARSLREDAAAHPGMTGIYPLDRPRDAFAVRALLARAADRSLDVQYYIWHGDTTGYLLLGELWRAAERGVRVRLLLDDHGTGGLDRPLAVFDRHANIEVRIFNPFSNRRFRAISYVTEGRRVNRRMHNKSFTADSLVTIVGGRNVGDEYFGAGDGMLFADLDVVAAGEVVGHVSRAFDEYWSSASAYPLAAILPAPDAGSVPELEAMFAATLASDEATEFVTAIRETRFVEQVLDRSLPLEWVPARLIYDDPAKALDKAPQSRLLISQLGQTLGKAERELDVISPYFVPGKEGTKALAAYPQSGVALRILTNSLAATDVAAVHSGYVKRRKPLLRSGAKLYELKPDPSATARTEEKQRSVFSSSAASLHAKSFAVDRQRLFVGSFNLDLRSIGLNTEMGLVIDSPRLASAMSTWFDTTMPGLAYEVRLDDDGRDLVWFEQKAEGEVRYDTEPKSGFFTRLGVALMSLIPADGML